MADGEGRVAVLVRVSATRPDGRSFDDPQMLLFTVDGDRVQQRRPVRRRPPRGDGVLGVGR